MEAALGQRNVSADTGQLRHLHTLRDVTGHAELSAEYQLLRCQTALLQGRDSADRVWCALGKHVRWWTGAPPPPLTARHCCGARGSRLS